MVRERARMAATGDKGRRQEGSAARAGELARPAAREQQHNQSANHP